jgi:hypothetical protein
LEIDAKMPEAGLVAVCRRRETYRNRVAPDSIVEIQRVGHSFG